MSERRDLYPAIDCRRSEHLEADGHRIYFEESGNVVPVMVSGTFAESGSTFVSGQVVEA